MVPSLFINQKMSFYKKIGSVQNNAALAITGAIQNSFQRKGSVKNYAIMEDN